MKTIAEALRNNPSKTITEIISGGGSGGGGVKLGNLVDVYSLTSDSYHIPTTFDEYQGLERYTSQFDVEYYAIKVGNDIAYEHDGNSSIVGLIADGATIDISVPNGLTIGPVDACIVTFTGSDEGIVTPYQGVTYNVETEMLTIPVKDIPPTYEEDALYMPPRIVVAHVGGIS